MGRVERFNRSLKEQGLQPEDLEPRGSLQPTLDAYRSYYNTQPPHQALGYQTPLELLQSKGYHSVLLNWSTTSLGGNDAVTNTNKPDRLAGI